MASVSIMNNPQYRSQGKTTFCNIGTQAINKMTGDYSLTGIANDMGIFLRNPQNATSLTQSEALEYANMGAVIFASYVSDGSEPGHIAVVAPTDKLSYSAQRKESVVSVFNIGKINGEMTLSEAFGKRDVGMFILNKDLETINTNFTIDGGSLGEIVVWGNNPNKNTNIGIKTEPINKNIGLNL